MGLGFDDAGADGGTFNYTASDGEFSSPANVTVASQVGAGASISDNFVGNQNLAGYAYVDAFFGGTGNYANGIWASAGNGNEGALHLDLGGTDGVDTLNMNGAFTKQFNLAQAAIVIDGGEPGAPGRAAASSTNRPG